MRVHGAAPESSLAAPLSGDGGIDSRNASSLAHLNLPAHVVVPRAAEGVTDVAAEVAHGWSRYGWRTRVGLLLNACCGRCRVWVTEDLCEFDGMPHRCPPERRTAEQVLEEFQG